MVSCTSSSHVLVENVGGLSWKGCEFNFRELWLVQLVAAYMDSLLTEVSQFKLNYVYDIQHSVTAGNAVSAIHIGFSIGAFDLTYIHSYFMTL